MDRRIPLLLARTRLLGLTTALAGTAVAGTALAATAGVGLASPAFAAGPTPTITLSVTPPFGEDGGGAPDPITGVETGTQILISIGAASQVSDIAEFPAPSGTVTLSDSRGLLTGCEADPSQSLSATALDDIAIAGQNPLYSVGYCAVSFPAGTTGSDVLTVTYGGDSRNGPGNGTETLDFAASPPPTIPETPFTAGIPLAAIGLVVGAVALRRRKDRRNSSRG